MEIKQVDRSEVSKEDQPIPQTFIQRWAMYLAGGILLLAIGAYPSKLSAPARNSDGRRSQN